jgi:hypothetical protein
MAGWSGSGPGPSPYGPDGSNDHIVLIVLIVTVAVVVPVLVSLTLFGFVTEFAHTGPGSTPIGTAVAFGNAGSSTCSTAEAATRSCVASGDWTFRVSVSQSSVDLNSVWFTVTTNSGAVFNNSGVGSFAVTDLSGKVAAVTDVNPGGLAMTASGTQYENGYTPGSPLLAGFTVWIDTGQPPPTPGLALFLVGEGAGGYTGSTAPLDL